MTNQIITPHAAMITWNYIDRIDGEAGVHDANSTEPLIINTYSLVSIQTQKTKSATTGNFVVTLAPSKNWVNTLTPGSWCCIMMSRTQIEPRHLDKADTRMVKFFGRIESARIQVNVDPNTGARRTLYIVSGSSWGSVFNTNLYIEPALRYHKEQSGFGVAKTLGLSENIVDLLEQKKFPNTDALVSGFLGLWTKADISQFKNEVPSIVIKSDSAWTVPDKVRDFFDFKDENDSSSTEVGAIIKRRFGKLIDTDEYKSVDDSFGVPDMQSIFGTHTLWQVLVAHSNTILNEMFCDLHVDNNRFQLALYKRIRPFVIRDSFDGQDAVESLTDGSSIISKFMNVKVNEIPKEDILSVEAGTNWRDKFNFIEVNASHGLGATWQDVSNATKLDSQIFDEVAFKREGLRPIIEKTKFYPKGKNGEVLINKTTNWKFLLKQWYFDTHRMLNGTITFIGQNSYIEVGQNIRFKSDTLWPSQNFNTSNRRNPNSANYITAHVESVAHSFTVDPNTGARHFVTTIQFVRGVLTNKNSKPIQETLLGVNTPQVDSDFTTPSLIDVDATDATPSADKNKRNVFGTSTSNDPDPQKVRGK